MKLISSKLTWVNRLKAGLKVYLKNRWRQRWCCGGSDFPFVEDEEERRKKKEERRKKKKEERRKKKEERRKKILYSFAVGMKV